MASMCILDWRVLYSMFCELLKGKKIKTTKPRQVLDTLISHKECPVKEMCVFAKSRFQTDIGRLVLRWTQILL